MLGEHNLRILDISNNSYIFDSIAEISELKDIKLDELRLRHSNIMGFWQVKGFISNWPRLKRIALSYDRPMSHSGFIDDFLTPLQHRKSPLELELFGNYDLLDDGSFPEIRTTELKKEGELILTIKEWKEGYDEEFKSTDYDGEYRLMSMEDHSKEGLLTLLNTESKPVDKLLEKLRSRDDEYVITDSISRLPESSQNIRTITVNNLGTFNILTIRALNDGQDQPYKVVSIEAYDNTGLDLLETKSKTVEDLLYNELKHFSHEISPEEPMSDHDCQKKGLWSRTEVVNELIAILKKNRNIKLIPSLKPGRPKVYLDNLTEEQNNQIGEAMDT